MKKLRILHVYRTYFPDTQGGLEEVIRQICRGTRAQGMENRVFTLSPQAQPAILQTAEAEVHRFHRSLEIASCGISLAAFAGFRRQVAWADIIHYHFPWPFADLLHFASAVNKPALVTYHSDIVRQKTLLFFYRPLMRAFLKRAARIVPTSQNYFATSAELGRYSDKVEVIPIGLDDNSYPQPTEEYVDRVRARHGKDFFLFIGVLRYYKGLHILLEAMQNAPFKCIIVGAGAIESELKTRAHKLGLDNVVFVGSVSDQEKTALLQLCRAVVFPSHLRAEAFGVTLLEGAMHSKALISTEIGTGTSYINLDGVTGLVIPPAHPAALRAAMLRLHEQPALATEMGAAARARYSELFSGKLMGERYARLYHELAAEKSTATAADPTSQNS